MKAKAVAAVFVIIAVLGVGALFLFNKSSKENPTSGYPAQGDMVGDTSSGKSVLDMLKLGNNLECSFSGDTEKGTLYIKDSNNIRADFTTMGQEPVGTSHMILAANTVYMWADQSPYGFKATLDKTDSAFEQIQEFTGSPSVQGEGLNKKMDYDCKNWSGDSSKFTVPADMTFQDYSDMINQFNNTPVDSGSLTPETMTADQKAYACQSCDSIPDESSKAQCKEALGC